MVEIGKHGVMQRGSLRRHSHRASLERLGKAIKGIGPDKAATLAAAFALAKKMADEMRSEAPLLDTPDAVANLLREDNRLPGVETFQIVLLNTRRRLIRAEPISTGTLDTILVHPREVFKPAIAANAAAVVLVTTIRVAIPRPQRRISR